MLNAKNVERDSNFELLRIVAMLMIIGHHLALYGAPCDNPSYISPNILLCQFIQGGGKLGDNIFILITGYFSITTDKVNYLKIYRLWKQMVFFMLVDYFIAAAAGYTSFSFLSFLSCLFPMMTGQYGFVTGYVTLLLFVPYLNRLLQSLSFREYGVFLISYFLVYGLLPSLGFAWVVGFSNIIWFVFIYSMGALFKLYGSKFCRSAKQYGLHALFWLFLTVSAVLIIDLVNTCFPPLWFDLTQFYNLYSLNIILLSADLFLFFAKKPPFQNKTINWLSSSTLAIYLFHENSNMRKCLWGILGLSRFLNKWYFSLLTVLAILGIFIVSILLDKLRLFLFESPAIHARENAAYNAVSQRISGVLSSKLN